LKRKVKNEIENLGYHMLKIKVLRKMKIDCLYILDNKHPKVCMPWRRLTKFQIQNMKHCIELLLTLVVTMQLTVLNKYTDLNEVNPLCINSIYLPHYI